MWSISTGDERVPTNELCHSSLYKLLARESCENKFIVSENCLHSHIIFMSSQSFAPFYL